MPGSGHGRDREAAAGPRTAARPAILTVDDEESIRKLLDTVLAPQYDHVAVASAEEAFEALDAQPFQLVITDLKLPGADGFYVCRGVKQRFPGTPVLMMTGMYGAQFASQALKEGVFSFPTKPIELARLLAVVQAALRHEAVAAGRHRGRA
jgi:two-component system response regulator HydG